MKVIKFGWSAVNSYLPKLTILIGFLFLLEEIGYWATSFNSWSLFSTTYSFFPYIRSVRIVAKFLEIRT